MKQLFLLGMPILAISACVPQAAPPPPPAAAAPYASGSTANTTTAFDGDYGAVIVRQVSPGCPNPSFPSVNLTIRNGLAQALGQYNTFQGYVTPQGALAMQSQLGGTFQGQISPNFVLTGRAQGPNCWWDVSWNRSRVL
jgi:hypothetical protein